MKINLKLISLITIFGTLFYFLGHKNKTIKSIVPIVQPKEQVIIVDKKTNSAKLPAPKVYISGSPEKNSLGLGNNWKSR
jgi:Zn-dependent protease with chaperone function